MSDELKGCVLGILVADGVDGGQVTRLCEAVRARGGRVHLIAAKTSTVHALDGWKLEADALASDVSPAYYDALLIPGGAAAVHELGNDGAVSKLLLGMGNRLRPIGTMERGRDVLQMAGFFDHAYFGPAAQSTDKHVGAEQAAREKDAAKAEDLVVAGANADDIDGFLTRFASELVKWRKRDYVDETSMESFPASDSPSHL